MMNYLGEDISNILSSFICDEDKDIENFLYEKAVMFEKASKSRTYLVFDEELFSQGIPTILAYFSISLKALILPEDMSVRKRKEMDGFSGKIYGRPVREIPCYLIGQLARSSKFTKSIISGADIIDMAMSVIKTSYDLVGGRWVLIECRNNPKLIEFYTENGFTGILNNPDGDIPMVQMIRKIE